VLLLIRDIANQAAYNLNLPPDPTEQKDPGRPKYNPVDGEKIVILAQVFWFI
jgi:hypothetical protein